jgi:hypothetical protein
VSWRGLFSDLGSTHALVDRHFAGTTGGLGERRMWRHLPRCARCRARYRAQSLLETLGQLDEGGDAAGAGAVHARQRLHRSVFGVSRPPVRLAGGVLLGLAAATALLLVRWRPQDEHHDGFQARGGLNAVAEPFPATEPFPDVELFRQVPGTAPADRVVTRVSGQIRAGDALAFAYRNPPERGRRYLMIFATDAAGRVFWYWPAWTDPASTPAAIPIQVSGAAVELAESVRHRLGTGTVRVVALFCDQAFTVKDVEAALARDARALDPLGCDLWQQPLEVLP